jgi:hypothetical protein
MTNRDERALDVLDRAIAALRDAPGPESPSPHLVASTVEALQSLTHAQTVRVNERRRLMFRIARYGSVAAAVLFLAVLSGWLFLMDRTAPLAFADVVDNIRKARSVTFVTKMPTIIKGTKRGILQQKFFIQGEAYRMEVPSLQGIAEVPAEAPPILMAVIADARKKKALQIDFVRKSCQNIKADDKVWQEMGKFLANPIEQLRQLKEQDAERIGEEELNGRKTQVYRLKKLGTFMGVTLSKDETAKLWVDPKSGLPVRIAIGDPSKLDKPFLVFEQFTWNDTLDPSLFSLEVPKGFALEQK